MNIRLVATKVRGQIETGRYLPSEAARYRVEKSKGLCRLMVAPCPEDTLILQAVSDTLYNQIKESSPSKNAFFEPKDHSFSKQKGVEPEYGTFEAWKKFQKKILGFQSDSNIIIVTDIANYYDFIDFNSLRNVLSAKKKINESLMDFLIFVLRSLSWQPDFMPFRSTGLPQIDIDAPRLLAHAYLFELDAFVERRNQKRYARFMDDIDAGVDTIADAKILLRDIDLVLQSRNLRLNSGKTKIMTIPEAARHFCIRENNAIDRIDERLSKLTVKAQARAGKRIASAVLSMMKNKKFDQGNSEKVLKRLIGLLNRLRIELPVPVFHDVVFRRPNVRVTAFDNAALNGFQKHHFDTIIEYYKLGLVCDDAFQMNLSKALVHGKIIYDGSETSSLNKLFDVMDKESLCGVHSTMWFLSRFGTVNTFLKFVESLPAAADLHPFSCRLIAGFRARTSGNPVATQRLNNLLNRFMCADAEHVNDFVYSVENSKDHVRSLLPTLLANNKSLALGCSHAKFMLIKCALLNPHVSASQKAKIRHRHNDIFVEKSYLMSGLI
ncbi:RNA-directed DNA polymerase [Georhizobium profundi]|uniref:RNA-directed DNA polymerase n=1 Tax=Georhizobium profundi TaxID=2341112 RepID=UPI0013DF9CB6|nr:RNA-directed DNA polymerase [Georhizobium profundi]